jgi:site-specific DNA-methyltransferase (adenine-specific)
VFNLADIRSKEEWINWGSRAVWNIASVRANDNHESKFPVELPRRLIQLLTDAGDTVLDCFIGSGTSAVAAIIEDRNYIGIDKKPKSVQLSNQACMDAFQNKATLESARTIDCGNAVPQMTISLSST